MQSTRNLAVMRAGAIARERELLAPLYKAGQSPRYAKNQLAAWRYPATSSAPKGVINGHKITTGCRQRSSSRRIFFDSKNQLEFKQDYHGMTRKPSRDFEAL
jgi:hypothetical protein